MIHANVSTCFNRVKIIQAFICLLNVIELLSLQSDVFLYSLINYFE